MKSHCIHPILKIALPILFIYLLVFHEAHDRGLWSSHEARAAQNAQGILDGAAWLAPRLYDRRLELQKPPLYYWGVAVIGSCFGSVNEFAVRFPASIGAILSALAVYCYFALQQKRACGAFGAMALLCMVHFTWMSRVGRIDMPLTAAVAWLLVGYKLAELVFDKAQMTKGYAWLGVSTLCLAAGLMLKGPIMLALAGVVILADAVVRVVRKEFSNFHLWPKLLAFGMGSLLVIGMVGPWVSYIDEVSKGKFTEEFVVKHNVQRGMGGDDQLDSHVHPWWYYLVRLPVDTAPWSVLGLVFLVGWRFGFSGFTRGAYAAPLRGEQGFGLVWFLSTLTLLSFIKYKRADYLLPAYPGLAIFLAPWLQQLAAGAWGRLGRYSVLACVIIVSLSWFVFAQWVQPRLEPSREMKSFATAVRKYLPHPGQVLVFRVDSHHMVWELGKAVERLWEWENLDWWTTRPARIFVILPEREAVQVASQLKVGKLFRLLDNQSVMKEKHELHLVLMSNQPDEVPMITHLGGSK